MVKKKKETGDVMLDPREIRFTHSRIRPTFSCGRRVQQTLEDLKSEKIKVSDLPRITVIQQGDGYFSMNNRRLWVMKQLVDEGLLPGGKVPVRIKAASEVRAAERFTPERCSYTAKFMNEVREGPRQVGQQDDTATTNTNVEHVPLEADRASPEP